MKVEFDPSVAPYSTLLDIFFEIHDPTTLNRQGLDIGSNYHSAILFTTPQQETVARQAIVGFDKSKKKFNRPIVTQVEFAGPFYRAEEYHQQYAAKHGGGLCHIHPYHHLPLSVESQSGRSSAILSQNLTGAGALFLWLHSHLRPG